MSKNSAFTWFEIFCWCWRHSKLQLKLHCHYKCLISCQWMRRIVELVVLNYRLSYHFDSTRSFSLLVSTLCMLGLAARGNQNYQNGPKKECILIDMTKISRSQYISLIGLGYLVIYYVPFWGGLILKKKIALRARSSLCIFNQFVQWCWYVCSCHVKKGSV